MSSRSPQDIPVIGIRTSTSSHRQSLCSLPCQCNCHKQRRFQSSPFFDSILGALFIGYSGCPYLFTHQTCTEKTCKSKAGFKAHVLYAFPLWLWNKLLDIHISASAYHEPCLSITVRAIIPASAEIFRLTETDDDKGLQQLFDSRLARPNDLMYGTQNNALTVCSKFIGIRR